MKKNNDTIPIVLASDDNFAKYAGICMISIMENKKTNRKIEFYLIDSAITEENKENLRAIAKKYNFDFNFLNIDESDYDNLHIEKQFTKTAYYRLDAPEKLKHYKKILYIDCDILLNSDISELFDKDIEENIIAAKCDKKGYFNSGVLLINTKKWLEQDIKKKCIDLIRIKMAEDVDFLALPDQNILNAVFAEIENSVLDIEYCWNVRTHQVNQYYDLATRHILNEERINGIKNPKLIHNTDIPKPIDYKYTFKFPFIWFFKFIKYKNKSPWKDMPIENFNMQTLILSMLQGFSRFLTSSNLTLLFKLRDYLFFSILIKNIKSNKTYFYGAGEYAKNLIKKYPSPKIKIGGFIDGDEKKKGTKLLGYDIYHISDVKNLSCETIIITMAQGKKYLSMIKQNINNSDIEYIVL